MECAVCYTPAKRAPSTCPGCKYAVCTGCILKWFADKSVATCPNCPQVWPREFFAQVGPAALAEYELLCARAIVEEEIALFPATQHLVPVKRQVDRDREALAAIKKRAATLSSELEDIRVEQRKISEAVSKGIAILQQAEHPSAEPAAKKPRLQTPEPPLFACPATGCRGFVTAPSNRCGICLKDACTACRTLAVPGGPHVCCPDNVLSVKAILNDTRPCPKCSTPIYKITGCDQMWCTACNTPFSWSRGTIISNTLIHNPHYFSWVAAGAPAVAPLEGGAYCGALPHTRDVSLCMGPITPTNYTLAAKLALLCEMRETVRSAMPGPHTDRSNTDLRIRFLASEITMPEFSAKVQQRARHHQRTVERSQLVEVFFHTIASLAASAIASHDPALEAQVDRAVAFFNENLVAISRKYKSTEARLEFTETVTHTPETIDCMACRTAIGSAQKTTHPSARFFYRARESDGISVMDYVHGIRNLPKELLAVLASPVPPTRAYPVLAIQLPGAIRQVFYALSPAK